MALVGIRRRRRCVKPVFGANEREETDNYGKRPVFWGRTRKINTNRTPTPSQTRRRRHRAFKEEDPSLTAAASPALADKMTFQIKPMAHV